MKRSLAVLLILPLSMAACSKSADDAGATNNVALAPAMEARGDSDAVLRNNQVADVRLPTDEWVGRWNGPEGLFLDIQLSPDGKAGHYVLTNKDNLDRQDDYNGMADGSTIQFERDGKTLTIRPGKGDETGFKYLAGKGDCLIVIAGQEGYCR
ncbi:hypothetical protein [Sphingobium sp.]|uniref:hypothetical protein n=1 Tax=Sphingobium sp. TaxID=1912891 RepID=UPI003BB494BB